MKIQSSDAVSVAGIEINEDMYRVFRNYSWVLDGSSGLGVKHISSAKTDAVWFAETVDKYLQFFCNPDVELAELVRQVIIKVNELFEQHIDHEKVLPYEYPSCSLALVRINPDGIDYLLLGDATIIVSDDEKVTIISDPTVSNLDNQVATIIQEIRQQKQVGFSEAKEGVVPLLQENRALMNTEGGYWVLGLEPTAVDHALKGTLKMNKATNLVLASDGFTRLVDTLHVFEDWQQLLTFIQLHGLPQAIQELRTVETNDAHCLYYPRLKTFDDATAVSLTLAPN